MISVKENYIERLDKNMEKIERYFLDLYPNSEKSLHHLREVMRQYSKDRHVSLRARDEQGTSWLESGGTVGMMLYVDLFAGNLEGLSKKIKYFKSLGITLIHLMPLLKPREGENDGGYAVSDYREIDPKLGTMNQFREMVKALHKEDIRVCIDYVLNHTANDHEWAKRALNGDVDYQSFYRIYDTDEVPRQFEKSLGQVFPKVAPGNFTYEKQMKKWVMTTFYPFQWDLNYENPDVFIQMAENMLFLANIGIDMIRLDAIPYIWKTLGTDCRNLPQVHQIMSLYRLIIETVAPTTALLGEAIVSPDEIVKYFGTEAAPECHVLYNASYMVELWNALATRDARHLTFMPSRSLPSDSCWINYARCHDDIGWGLDENNIRNMGFDPISHKFYLIDFYYGSLKDSFSKGELYEFNPDTMDARNSGTFASLCGLESALEARDHYQRELAIKRVRLMNALFILRKGIPMIYSGDEYGALNNYSYKQDPNKSHDSRWVHRSPFNWEIEHAPSPEQMAINQDIRELIKLRTVIQHGQEEHVLVQGNPHVFSLLQADDDSTVLMLFNLSEDRQWVYSTDLLRHGLRGKWDDCIQGKRISLEDEKTLLGPYEFLVLKQVIN